MSDGRVVCLRCGNFLEKDAAPVEGVALCASCLEGKAPGKDQVFTYPPRSIVWKRVRPFTALGFVGGFVLSLHVFSDVLAQHAHEAWVVGVIFSFCLIAGACGALVGEVTALGGLYVAIPGQPMQEWKRILLERLGLPKDSDAFSLVLFARRRVRATDLRMPLEIGLLARSKAGLVFLGERGTRFAIPITAVMQFGFNLMPFLPPRRSVRFDLADGREIFFVPLESRSPRESSRLLALLAGSTILSARVARGEPPLPGNAR